MQPFCADCGGPYGVNCCDGSIPCYAAAQHAGIARDFILALKYKNMRPIGEAIGMEMAQRLPRPDADMLIPMPLHKDSPRPFNQTELITEGLSSVWSIPVESTLLKWRFGSVKQTNKKGRERMMLSFDSFEAKHNLHGHRVALIDDVYTTGSTVRAAKFALQRAGADIVAIYVWTRRLRYPVPEA